MAPREGWRPNTRVVWLQQSIKHMKSYIQEPNSWVLLVHMIRWALSGASPAQTQTHGCCQWRIKKKQAIPFRTRGCSQHIFLYRNVLQLLPHCRTQLVPGNLPLRHAKLVRCCSYNTPTNDFMLSNVRFQFQHEPVELMGCQRWVINLWMTAKDLVLVSEKGLWSSISHENCTLRCGSPLKRDDHHRHHSYPTGSNRWGQTHQSTRIKSGLDLQVFPTCSETQSCPDTSGNGVTEA